MAGQAAPTAPTNQRPASWEDVVRAISQREGVNPALALAVMTKESSRNPNAVGDSGKAIGFYQLHEAAASDVGLTPEDRLNPLRNIEGGVKYLKLLNTRYGGDVNKALMAYNGGMGNVDAGTISPEAQAYASDVIASLSQSMRAGRASGAGPGPAPSLISTDLPNPEDVARRLVEPYDPRQAEGRQNIAALGGSLAASFVTRGMPVGAIGTRIANVLLPIVGAGTATAAEVATEQLASGGEIDLPAAASAGMWQSAYEAGGQSFMWPVRRFTRALTGLQLAPHVRETLKQEAVTTRQTGRDAVDFVRDQVNDTVQAVRNAAAAKTDLARQAGVAAVRGAKQTASDLLAQTELANTARVFDVTRAYDNLLGQQPSQLTTGAVARDVLQGPAKRALDIAGQRVAEAAESGPMIDFTPIKSALEAMATTARPSVLFGTQKEQAGIGFLRNLEVAARGTQRGAAAASADPTRLNAAIAEALGVPVEQMDPRLPGLLGKIQGLKDPLVSFADAHQIKRLLDETVSWDRRAKKHLEQITKGLRQTLRESMTGHAPYDEATAAYHALVPLYTKGVGKQILSMARQPDGAARIAQMLKHEDVSQTLVLRNLLVDQAAAGGEAQMGLQAWDAVRAAYTHEHLLTGGIEKLAPRLEKLVTLRPEFVRAVYGDAPGQQVLKNLGELTDAYKMAQQINEGQMAAAKTSAQGMVEGAKDTAQTAMRAATQEGREAVRQATQTGSREIRETKRRAEDARQAVTERLKAFRESSLYKYRTRSIEGELADVSRAAALGLRSIWGAQSLIRLLQAPNAGDIVEWAAYSNYNTGRIKRALTSPVAPAMLAGLMREIGGVLNGTGQPLPPPLPPADQPSFGAAKVQ